MSEDKTGIPGNEEPTEGLETQKTPTTNMMIETLLLEMREGFARMDSRFDALEKRLYTVERKFDVFSIELISVKASMLDHQDRLDKLEKAS